MTTLFGEQINTLNSDKIYNHLENGQFSALSDVELIYGIVGDEELAGRIYQTAGKDWSSLFKYSISELMKIPGIGKKRATALVAAMEMGRRKLFNTPNKKAVLRSSDDIYSAMRPVLSDLNHEEIWLITLDAGLRMTSKTQIGIGGRNCCIGDIPIIMKKAIEKNAKQIVLCHNHPSGVLRPSREDDLLTERLAKAGAIMDIKLIDHVIITDNGYYSYSDEGRISL